MNLLTLTLILILIKFIAAKRNVFDQILKTFEGEIEKVHCVILMKADGGIPFEESTSVPIINVDINNFSVFIAWKPHAINWSFLLLSIVCC